MRRTLTSVLLALAALAGSAGAAFADTPADIIVEDTAGVLDLATLLPAVEEIDFHEPTTVAIYTRAGKHGDNFNEEVRAYARAEHPEWLAADGHKWANGLYLFALDTAGEQVGAYMGEDRKVDLDARTRIRDSTNAFLQAAEWTDGTIRGIEFGAAVISRPWYESPGFVGIAGLLALGCTGAFLILTLVPAKPMPPAPNRLYRTDVFPLDGNAS